METNELIVTDLVTGYSYEALLRNAVEYAMLSIPVTFDRMGIRDLNKKILNIAKGKFAENILAFFLTSKGIAIEVPYDSQPIITNTIF